MAQHTTQSRSDAGAVLVHAALVLIGLMALSTFIIDYGVLWASRRQAQNAADAGALAGAIHMMYDTNLNPTGDVLTTATDVALQNRVWATAPAATAVFECPPYVAVGVKTDCIRVDVFRDQAHNNALPMFFGRFLGRNLQNIRATATARVNTGNSTDCLKPFAVPDFYTTLDSYSAPGYTVATHEGTVVQLKSEPNGDQLSPGWYQLLDFTSGAGGADEVRNAIASCQGGKQGVGGNLLQQTGSLGTNIADTVNQLYALDPSAHYVPGQGVIDSCADTRSCSKLVPDDTGNGFHPVPDPNRTISPRILIVPVFDPVLFFASGGATIKIVNLLGFFIDAPMAGPPDFDLRGILVLQPGLFSAGFGSVPSAASFLKIIQLIR
jgi:Flp pilus assembly protein TadG